MCCSCKKFDYICTVAEIVLAFLLIIIVKNLTMKTSLNTTNKVKQLRGVKYTDEELSKLIGISRPTLYTRLRLHNWKKGEKVLIKNIK